MSHARSGGYAELEAMTAERDFFREKYAEQMNVMGHLNDQLKESKRVINKLRSEILDLEVEKSSLVEQGGTIDKAPKQIGSSGGSTDTSVTGLSCDEDSFRSDADSNAGCTMAAKSASEGTEVAIVEDTVTSLAPIIAGEPEEHGSDPVDAISLKDDDQSTFSRESDEEGETEDEEEDHDEGGDEDDEADKIRANATKMLLWANYQSSKRSTPNTSYIQESNDELDDDDTEGESDDESIDISFQ